MTVRRIDLYEDIGEYDVSAQSFAREMAAAAGSDIELHICCYGGEVSHGFAIANMVKAHVGKKVAIVDGYCASAATFVAMYCDEIRMHEMSMLMMHRSLGGAWGHADELDDKARALNNIDSIMAAAYKAKTGADDATVASWMAGDMYLTPAQALAAKLCDSIIPGPSPRAAATAKSPKFYALAGKLPESVRAFLNPAAAAPKAQPVAAPIPPSGVIKMKSTAITRGLLLGLTALAHFGALAGASADPEEKQLGEQLNAIDVTAARAVLADVKDAPELTALLALHAKAVELVGSPDGLCGGLDALALNSSAKGAAASMGRMAQVDALLASAVTPQKGADGITPPRKLTQAQAAGQRAQFVANLDKPIADLAAFIRLAHPLVALNTAEDQGSGASTNDGGELDPEYAKHANAGKVL